VVVNSPYSDEPLGVRNVANTFAAAYTDQARPSQNALCYCLGYLQHALAKNNCTFYVQNLGMLLGHLKAEKVHVVNHWQ
jgi:hypothetical protein